MSFNSIMPSWNIYCNQNLKRICRSYILIILLFYLIGHCIFLIKTVLSQLIQNKNCFFNYLEKGVKLFTQNFTLAGIQKNSNSNCVFRTNLLSAGYFKIVNWLKVFKQNIILIKTNFVVLIAPLNFTWAGSFFYNMTLFSLMILKMTSRSFALEKIAK